MATFKAFKTGWMRLGIILLCSWLSLGLIGCENQTVTDTPAVNRPLARTRQVLKVVESPQTLTELNQGFEENQPQVTLLSPKPDEILQDTSVSLRFEVKDLPIYKEQNWGLGPHLHVILDNQPYQAVYDLSQPLVFENLTPGTHTLRVFASRPWHESFKNVGAYTQSTFHVFTKTNENQPISGKPLLTYSRPNGSYGAEPIMLDFYLTDAPLHMIAQENSSLADWRVRCTVNGSSVVVDTWEPIYLQGFKPGRNWVQLELIDTDGNPIPNLFNNTARLITYQPGGGDTLSQLVRGELSLADIGQIVDPDYVPPTPEPAPEATTAPEPALGSDLDIDSQGESPSQSESQAESAPASEPASEIEVKSTRQPEAPPAESVMPAPAETDAPVIQQPIEQPEVEQPEVEPIEKIAPPAIESPDINLSPPEPLEPQYPDAADAPEPELIEPKQSQNLEDLGFPESDPQESGLQESELQESGPQQPPSSPPIEQAREAVSGFFNRFRRDRTPTVQTAPPSPDIIAPTLQNDEPVLKPFMELEQGDFQPEQVPDIVDLLEKAAQENAVEEIPENMSENRLDSRDSPEQDSPEQDSLEQDLPEQDSPEKALSGSEAAAVQEQTTSDEAPQPSRTELPPIEKPQPAEKQPYNFDNLRQRFSDYRKRSLESRGVRQIPATPATPAPSDLRQTLELPAIEPSNSPTNTDTNPLPENSGNSESSEN